ncbi:MAG: FKBP-type peptidyl-prolyl cis-trans isomerase [Bacteroidales bacterium]|jgi:peptidylprolyl isomerase|nr:FKBP-type peptidyl-prolyl cis-trans isomerase [Bacteroidales bacterium]MBR1436674.1 FKBP-type peptidyl-prolyl cis-trans isomerase [Bacteroidales bacterium]
MFKKRNRRPDPYRKANEDFLSAKAAEEGVTVLDNGVMYKVLEKGSGKVCPKPSGIVYVHYTGRLVDGTVFDSTREDSLPGLFVVRDLIMGWQIALTRMHEGDRWEVYIPAKWGYGSVRMDDIPANSTLIFDMELVKIER